MLKGLVASVAAYFFSFGEVILSGLYDTQVRIRCDPGAVTPSFSSPCFGHDLSGVGNPGYDSSNWQSKESVGTGGRSQVRTNAPSSRLDQG